MPQRLTCKQQQRSCRPVVLPPLFWCVVCLQAVTDFMERIAKYQLVYEPITDRSMHYIKLTDM